MTNKEALLLAYECGYRVSTDGNLTYKNFKIPKCRLDQDGYLCFTINATLSFKNRLTGLVKIHRLMAYQKFGNKIFDKGIEVRHLNNIKIDNRKNNISIGTHSENYYDLPRDVRRDIAIKAARKRRLITLPKANEIRRQYNNKYITTYRLSKIYGICISSIKAIIENRTYIK